MAKQQRRWNAPIRVGSFVATYGEPAIQTQTQTRMCRLFPNLPPPSFFQAFLWLRLEPVSTRIWGVVHTVERLPLQDQLVKTRPGEHETQTDGEKERGRDGGGARRLSTEGETEPNEKDETVFNLRDPDRAHFFLIPVIQVHKT